MWNSQLRCVPSKINSCYYLYLIRVVLQTETREVGSCKCCLHIPSQYIPSKPLNLSPAANFHQEKPLIKFTECSQNWLWVPQSLAGSTPALQCLSVMHPQCFKACAGHLEGGRRQSAVMCSLFLQMKMGKVIWFPMTHSPASFWSLLAIPKLVEIFWGAQGGKCWTGIIVDNC